MTTRRLIIAYAILMAVLSAAYYLFPGLHMLIWTTIGASSAVAMAVGAYRNRPRRRTPWLLLSGAVLALAIGDTTYLFLTDVLGQNQPFPSWADVVYLAFCFPLMAAGLLGLARSGAAPRDRASLLDALALTVGLGLLSWLFLIEPFVKSEDLSAIEKAISIAYPLYDVLILAVIAHLVIAVRRTPSVILLGVGALGLLVADVLYGLSQFNNYWFMGGPVDLGWIILYFCWGLAALHPSMVELTEPRALRHRGLHARRLVLLALSALVAPAVVLIQVATHSVHSVGVAALASMVMFVLVLSRLYGAISVYRDSVGRERALREAGAALVSATGPDGVRAAVREAVGKLVPSGTPHRVVLTLDDTGPSTSNGRPRPLSPPNGRSPLSLVSDRPGPQVLVSDRPRPQVLVSDRPRPRSGAPAVPNHADGRRTRLVYTRSLTGLVAAELGAGQPHLEIAAQSPLVISHRPSGGPHIGTLYVASDESCLVALQESLEVLASQAALALERIALNEEISRRSSEEYFRTLVHNTADVILILDEDDRVRYASPSGAALLGTEDLVGTALFDLVHPDSRAVAGRVLDLVRAGEHRTAGDDWVVLGPDGSRVQVDASCRDLRDDATVDGLVVTLRDVTERRRLERELRHRAFHDALTGLANRALFQERVRQALSRGRREGGVVGILFIDLDDFKVVNDTMGHAAGDELLVAVSRRLSAALRPTDSVARLGGDEFAALIEDAREPAEIEEVATRVVASFVEPFRMGNSIVSGQVSIGIATTPEAANFEDLLRQADLALYVAKGAGKAQWRRYQASLHNAVLQRLELRAELDQAIATEAFRVEYQPIVALDTGETAGLEALVRWHHPTRGLLPPDQFIDVAEESGLVVPIGAWVLERALKDAAAWCRTLPGRPYVSVNVSVRQFRDPSFLGIVRRQLDASGLPPDRLVLEITESLLLRDDDQVRADLTTLRELGVRIAIDDFGTGYSSLSYLRQVPADILKIEKSFIDTISVSPKQRALVEGILRLAHTLGLTVVAEGIEREGDRDVLMAIGCRYGQGYLFCRPLSYRDAVTRLIRAQVPA